MDIQEREREAMQVLVRVKGGVTGGRVAMFGLRFDVTGTPTIGDLEAMANDGQTVLNTNAGLYASDFFLGSVSAQGYERVADTPPYFTPLTVEVPATVAGQFGTAVGNSLPPQNAVVVSFTTGTAGRRGRGRVYTFPPPEGVVNAIGDVSDQAARAQMVEDMASAIESSLTPTDVDHIVHSVTYGDISEVTGYFANNRIDTQRRRLRRS